MTIRQMLLGWWADLPMVMLYDLRDDGRDPGEPEHNFGLLAVDYSEKPAFAAAKTMLRLGQGKKLTGLNQPSALPTGANIARLEGPDETVYVAWCDERLPAFSVVSPGPQTKIFGMTGKPMTPGTSEPNAPIRVGLGSGPIFIVVPQEVAPRG
jgi:hypothetical protein